MASGEDTATQKNKWAVNVSVGEALTSVLGKPMAYSGGGFFRLLPYWLVSRTMKQCDYNVMRRHIIVRSSLGSAPWR